MSGVEEKENNIRKILNISKIYDVRFTPSITAPNENLNEEDFKRIVAVAKEENKEILLRWHFAPWFKGTFKIDKEIYLADIYLGGLVIIRSLINNVPSDNDNSMFFTFDPKILRDKK